MDIALGGSNLSRFLGVISLGATLFLFGVIRHLAYGKRREVFSKWLSILQISMGFMVTLVVSWSLLLVLSVFSSSPYLDSLFLINVLLTAAGVVMTNVLIRLPKRVKS